MFFTEGLSADNCLASLRSTTAARTDRSRRWSALALGLSRSGAVAVIALAAYTLVRQGILGLRDEPRHWLYGRAVTASLAAAALIAGVVLLALAA